MARLKRVIKDEIAGMMKNCIWLVSCSSPQESEYKSGNLGGKKGKNKRIIRLIIDACIMRSILIQKYNFFMFILSLKV